MNRFYVRYAKSAVLFLMFVAMACKKHAEQPVQPAEPDTPKVEMPTEPETPGTGAVTKQVNWDNRSGAYTTTMAQADLGSLTGWKEARTSVVDGALRLKLEKNALSSAGGIVANIDLEEGSEYEVQFKTKFDGNFDWGKGGKVGFGFRIGDGNTGCDRADDGNGGSARMMWYNSNGNIVFKPYMYYKDMPDQCGDNLISSARYPTSGSLQKNIWYTIKIYIKSNTGSNKDGHVKFTVNNQTVLDQPIRWTTNDAKRLINQLAFSTFRGGSTSDWESATDGYIYFDDLSWTKFN